MGSEYKFGKRRIPAPDMHKQVDFLRSYRTETQWSLDKAGDGSNVKFGPGFSRGQGKGKDLIAARRKQETERYSRRQYHDERRRKHMLQQENRNGFNVVTGAYDASKHAEAKRRRRFIDHGASRGLLKEGDRAMRDTALRFFRSIDGKARCSLGPARDDSSVKLKTTALAEDFGAAAAHKPGPGSKRAVARARLLAMDGLPDAPRKSGVLGLGRGDMPSYGVADNFAHSLYDPKQRPPSPGGAGAADVRKAAEQLALASTYVGPSTAGPRKTRAGSGSASGGTARGAGSSLPSGDPSTDPFARTMEARFQASRLPRGQKAPNRVIGDEGGPARIAPAVSDPEKAMIRLDREIRKKVGPRPSSRPKSLLARAAQMRFYRELVARRQEIAAVSALR